MIDVSPPVLWFGFAVLLGVCLVIDLLLHRRPREVGLGEAAKWTAGWIALALGFAGVVWLLLGGDAATQFAAAYLIEWSLSVDNVFVFVLIMASLAIPAEHQHRVLFAGVLGAIVMRLGFILVGSGLLHRFEWLIYPFGAVLLIAAFRFLRAGEHRSPGLQSRTGVLLRRLLPLTDSLHEGRMIAAEGGRRVVTPLLVALLLVESADLVFAIDSIPAVFALTRDPFVAFSSNALAVLGLRSLYFLLKGAIGRFRYLKPALALLLAFVGAKMIATPLLHVPTLLSLGVIIAILGTAALASWIAERRRPLRGRDT